jgi:hypothetical protein
MLLGINLTLLIGPTLPLPAPISLIMALRSIEVTNTDEGRDGFQISFAVGRSGPADILDYSLMNNPLLKPFSRVIIMMTFGAMPKVLIDGIVTHQQFAPSTNPGQSTLTLTGEDVSVMMGMKEKSVTHPNQPDIAIVSKIILSYAQYGLVPTVIPPLSIDVPSMVDMIYSQQGTDLDYILRRARLYNYVFYIEPTDVPGVNIAYWGPSNLTSVPQKALTVNMGPDTNVASINFQNNALAPSMVVGSIQDRMTNMNIPIVTFRSLRPPLASQPAWLVNQPNVRSRQFQSEGGINVLQAYTQAQSETDKSADAVTASGELDTLHYGDILRARKLVGLRGAGYTYDGFYYVKSVTHKIKRGQYTQSFTLAREGVGSITPVVQP